MEIIDYAKLLSSLNKANDTYTMIEALEETMNDMNCSLEDAYNILMNEFLNEN